MRRDALTDGSSTSLTVTSKSPGVTPVVLKIALALPLTLVMEVGVNVPAPEGEMLQLSFLPSSELAWAWLSIAVIVTFWPNTGLLLSASSARTYPAKGSTSMDANCEKAYCLASLRIVTRALYTLFPPGTYGGSRNRPPFSSPPTR